VQLKNTGYTIQKNNEHCNNYITETNKDGVVKNRPVHFDFRWQRNPRSVAPRAGTLHKQQVCGAGVARGRIKSNRSNRVKAGRCIYDGNHKFL